MKYLHSDIQLSAKKPIPETVRSPLTPIFLALILAVLMALSSPDAPVSAHDDHAKLTDLTAAKGLSTQIPLTGQEQAWLDRRHTVRVRIGDAPPYQMTTPEPQGIAVDYLKLIGKRFGINFVFVINRSINWEQTLEDLTGERQWLDLVVAIKKTPEREKTIAFTDDYISSPWVIVNRTDSDFISRIQDLRGKKVAVEKGFVVTKLIEKEYPEIRLVPYTTSLEALQSVASGVSDAYIANLAIASYLIRHNALPNLKIAAPTPFGNHDQAMGVRKDWPELASIINKAFIALSDAEEDEIRNRWLSIRYEYGINAKTVWSWIVGVATVFSLVLTVVLIWNRRLKREIALRIKAEDELNRAVAQDISQRLVRDRDLTRNIERLELMQKVAQYHTSTVQELLDFSLEKVIALTESSIGYIYHYSEETQQFVLNSWSKGVMPACNVAEAPKIYHLDKTGLWGEVVRQRRAIMVNDYAAPSGLKKGHPEGHVALSRFLSIPVFDNDRIVAVVGVANKALPYDQTDQIQLTLMIDGVWKIASRLALEKQVSQVGQEWQTTFDAISDSITLINVDQRVVRCNRATKDLLGRTFKDIINQPCWQLFHDSDVPVPGCPMTKVKSSLQTETATIQHHDRWLEVTVDPLLSADGELTGAIHIVRDVTAQVELVHSLKNLNELFSLFMKYSPIYCYIKVVSDTESTVLQASDNFIDMVGIPATVVIGKNMHQLFPQEFADKVTADDLQVVSDQKVLQVEEELHGNSYITYKFPIKNRDGKNILAGYTIDITTLKQTEEALRKSSQYLEKLISYANAPIIVWDAQQIITRFNHAFEHLTGYQQDEVINQPLVMLFPEETKANWLDEIADTAEGDMLECVEIPIRCKNGTVRFVLWNSANIYDTDAVTLLSTIAQGVDITERRAAEMTLFTLQAQLMQNDKLATIGQLAAGVAHEINNPMGFVSSNMITLGKYVDKYHRYIELLEQEVRAVSGETLPEQLRDARKAMKLDYIFRDINVLLDESNEGIERVKRIVMDMRILSRTDAFERASADLNSCIDSTINIVFNEIKYAAELKLYYGLLPKVSCNIQQISQVLMNLLINAAHAIQAKGDEFGEIIICTWCDHENAFVSITDSGCGIPPEQLGKIFDAFFTTKEVGKGTGLGLSISSEIIRKHGGEISVASTVGAGSTFTVRLPLN